MTEQEKIEFATLKECVNCSLSTMKALDEKTDLIFNALVGNNLTHDGGIVGQINNMKNRQDLFEKRIDLELAAQNVKIDKLISTIGRWKGIAVGMLLCGGVIGYLIKIILDSKFK